MRYKFFNVFIIQISILNKYHNTFVVAAAVVGADIFIINNLHNQLIGRNVLIEDNNCYDNNYPNIHYFQMVVSNLLIPSNKNNMAINIKNFLSLDG